MSDNDELDEVDEAEVEDDELDEFEHPDDVKDEFDDEDEDDEEVELVCMPIFKQFKPETLREMVAQPWDEGDSGNLTLMEINDQWVGSVCPIAFCLYKEGKAWLTDRDGGFEFQATPDGDHIARQLMGLARSDLVPAVRLDEYSRLVTEASDFYTPWDENAERIDLAKAACLDEPATVGVTNEGSS